MEPMHETHCACAQDVARLERERDEARATANAACCGVERQEITAIRARVAELEAALREHGACDKVDLPPYTQCGTCYHCDEINAILCAPEPRCECGNPYEHGLCVYCKEPEPREAPLTPCRAEHEFRPVDRAMQDRLCRVCLQYESEILAGKPEPLPPLPHPPRPECDGSPGKPGIAQGFVHDGIGLCPGCPRCTVSP